MFRQELHGGIRVCLKYVLSAVKVNKAAIKSATLTANIEEAGEQTYKRLRLSTKTALSKVCTYAQDVCVKATLNAHKI